MKIYTISSVHNEQDVIESLCRYYLQFCDGMIIYDSLNNDNTIAILRQLIDEGLNIHLVEAETLRPLTDLLRNIIKSYGVHLDAMVQMAFDQFGADLVLPVDADEFLFCHDGENPRSILETFNPGAEYWIPWQTYIFTKEATDNTKFLPDYFPYRRLNEITRYCKAVVSRKLWTDYECRLGAGAHHLTFNNSDRTAVPVERISSLYYAHYPIRSRFQAIRKSIEMEFILSSKTDRFQGEGYQYLWALKKIMQTGTLTVDEAKLFSLRYSVNIPDDVPEESIPVVDDPPKTSFDLETLSLKYTDYSVNENLVFRTVVSEAYRIICAQTEALRKEIQARLLLKELVTVETFLREAPEEEIRKEATPIFEWMKLNFEKLKDPLNQNLEPRFEAALSRIQIYLLNPQAP